MWTRDELKSRAKSVLRFSYWKAFAVSLVLAIVTGSGSSNGNNNSNVSFQQNWQGDMNLPSVDFLPQLPWEGVPESSNWFQGYLNFVQDHVFPGMLPLLLGGATLMILAMLAIRLFVGFSIEVGCRRYFTSAAAGQSDMGNLAFGFRDGRYWNIFCTMLYRGIINFLWYLLLIVPGIVKSYAYDMVPYILADNPRIHYHRALQLSEEMTRGHKFDMFVLDLSFFGWYLLGAFACGLGGYFVNPYYDSTKAELYMVLRHNAVVNGMTSPQELWLAQ